MRLESFHNVYLHSSCILYITIFFVNYTSIGGFPGGSVVKNPPANAGDKVWSMGQEDPWRRKWQPRPVFSSGEFHGQRSLVGYSPQGCKRVGHDLATKQQNTSIELKKKRKHHILIMQLPSSKKLKSLDSTHSKQMANALGQFYIQKVMAIIRRKIIQITLNVNWAHYVANTVRASRSNRQKRKEEGE